MGKATGFMDYDRQDKMAEDPKERIKHFKEFHTPLSKEEQELQGALDSNFSHLQMLCWNQELKSCWKRHS